MPADQEVKLVAEEAVTEMAAPEGTQEVHEKCNEGK
jgi:hypothetical protein